MRRPSCESCCPSSAGFPPTGRRRTMRSWPRLQLATEIDGGPEVAGNPEHRPDLGGRARAGGRDERADLILEN